MPKYLGIDYGLERTGLAITDPAGKIAFPLTTLSLKACVTRKALLDKIAQLVKENQIQAIIMGLPVNEDGSENLSCVHVRKIAKRLNHRVDTPIYFISEFLSSYAAEEELRLCGKKGKDLYNVLDQQAACLILTTWINQHTFGGICDI